MLRYAVCPGPPIGRGTVCIFQGRGDFIEKNPATTQRLVNAFMKSLKWLASATPEDVADTVPTEYHLGDKALYRQGENWMIATPEVRLRDQFFFDLERRQLIDYPLELDGSRRISVLRMAGDIGNPDTLQLLHDLALTHPCRRTRLAACTSFARLAPASEARALWQRACDDPEPMVALAARRQLQEPVDAVTSID